jgi:hypothetical protein
MKQHFLLLAILVAGSAQAWDCKYEKDIDTTLSLAGSEQLSVVARAGELKIAGHTGAAEARVQGKVCASSEEWLQEAEIVTESGRHAAITVTLPDTDNGWRLMGNRYVYMDLEIEVPAGLALDIRDSSGDVDIRGTGPVSIRDSSGDIEMHNVHGSVVL